MKLIKTLTILMGVSLCLVLASCSRSHVIVVSLTNTSAQPLSGLVVDYPEATFGRNVLKPGETYQYRIKATDSGPLKITFINAGGQSRNYSLATLHPNDEGSIDIKLTQDAAVPDVRLNASR
ncbi:MAG: hypothetical protein LAP21_05905 [Acidobacteriia bacterium]|nr:hypothetical protein [Terriglobia bacterium]